MLVERYVIPAGDSVGLAVVRALVLLKLTNLLFQIEIFMCTDVYALFALATRSRNLWATKGAVARRLLRRATPADRELLELLAASGSREVRWATVYLALDVPGSPGRPLTCPRLDDVGSRARNAARVGRTVRRPAPAQ